MGSQDLCFIIFLVGFYLQAQAQTENQNLTCNPSDLAALRGFFNSLDSRIDGLDTDSTDCCNWVGITCNSSSSLGLNDTAGSSRVTMLALDKRRLTGSLSDSVGNLDQLRILNLSHNFLKSSLPPSLFNLPNLQVLDLNSNDLYGPFPETINFPSQLGFLNLSHNFLKGSLPLSLFHLPYLQVLDLNSNEFYGPLPLTINLPSLHLLDISSNSLNTSVPTHICYNSSEIRVLRLSVNYFSGHLSPGLGNCVSLEELCLGMNNLSGVIAEDIFHLQNLSSLSLQDNRFSGQLSSSISNLSSIKRLDISANEFSGMIPDVFVTLSKFQYLVAHSNKFSGRIPISLSNSPTLHLLNLRNNSLAGSLDLNCSAMTSLTSLDLGTNRFTGSLPSNLPFCRQLKSINLARNNLSGQIPESFGNFQSLSYLSLTNAGIVNLSSALQILQHCSNLTALVLTRNFPDEELPADPGLQFQNLKALVIANCRLRGLIPQWLSGCTKLQLLDLSWNQLSGRIPDWFGSFNDLFYLDLSNNTFIGEIPKSITGLPSLISRNISLEEPSPDIPFFLKRNDSVRGFQYNQILSFPPTIYLSHNALNGSIWPEFGNLKKLNVLNLKANDLSGPIPSELSGMTSLESLDLSHNNLTGTIPSSLVELSFLSKFSVAFNQLYGKIPSGGQFATFPNSSFEGNNNLCGEHLLPCANSDKDINQVPVGSPEKSKRSKAIIIGMVVGVIFGTAFLLVLMTMILLWARRQGEVDPETQEADANDKDPEELSSRSLVLFQNKENNKELSIDDLLKSTNNFDQANIIGCGGFGLVYRATLPDGGKVAVKRLSGDSGQMDREFRAEVETLSRAQHPNLVHLQGYCIYNSDRLLIYSYMENGSLDYWLHEKLDGPSLLDWDTRLQIAQGAARGLTYLHQSCEPHILHRDIKSSNILLDENFVAHLADFGLARLILPYDTHVTTDLVGTLGYIPPEYGQASVATYKGDVYSFGVVLLELLTGKRPMDMCKPRGCRNLISWVIQMKEENRESEVLDPFIYDKKHDKELLRVLDIACLCLSESPKLRPTMQQLVSWLDNII
ncbi:phytosulfokine receptor 1 [Mangifera indica]|uniref:phytosulfokine receptor 1 n=1 Tax=Mangifera indica TaxID=29780 RepID=UPI001CF943BB|nr:phytosulfokine receptor 1 [Mangifera indica]